MCYTCSCNSNVPFLRWLKCAFFTCVGFYHVHCCCSTHVYVYINTVSLRHTRTCTCFYRSSSQFIAHPACQRQLIGLWYSDIPWMRHQHVIIKLLAVPLTTLLLPLFSLVFLFAPSSIVSHAAIAHRKSRRYRHKSRRCSSVSYDTVAV